MKCNFKKLSEESILPTKSNDNSAGIDFYSTEDIRLLPFSSNTISTGISWNPTKNPNDFLVWWLNIRSRSGMAIKKGIECSTAGVIDQDYTGGIKILLKNDNDKIFDIRKGDKIAQGIVSLAVKPEDVEVLSKKTRDEKGFGSSDERW